MVPATRSFRSTTPMTRTHAPARRKSSWSSSEPITSSNPASPRGWWKQWLIFAGHACPEPVAGPRSDRSRADLAPATLGMSELREDLPVEICMTSPRLAGYDAAVTRALLVDPGATTTFQLETHVRVTRELHSAADPRCKQDLDAVTDGENPFLLLAKALNDLDELLVVSKKFGRASADQQHGGVVVDSHVVERDVALD